MASVMRVVSQRPDPSDSAWCGILCPTPVQVKHFVPRPERSKSAPALRLRLEEGDAILLDS